MDCEYIADSIAGRIRDFILYDTEGNYNSESEVARKYDLIRLRLRGTVGIDALEPLEPL